MAIIENGKKPEISIKERIKLIKKWDIIDKIYYSTFLENPKIIPIKTYNYKNLN